MRCWRRAGPVRSSSSRHAPRSGTVTLAATVSVRRPDRPGVRVGHVRGGGLDPRCDSRDLVIEIGRTRHIPAMPHLTCVGHSKGELVTLLESSPRTASTTCWPWPGIRRRMGPTRVGDFRYAAEFWWSSFAVGDFSVGVAAFPEGHSRARRRWRTIAASSPRACALPISEWPDSSSGPRTASAWSTTCRRCGGRPADRSGGDSDARHGWGAAVRGSQRSVVPG